MAYVYRYTDLSDGIIKYVGIVWSENRTLDQRINEHKKDEWYSGKNWKIEFICEDIESRTDAEYFESHYISLFKTDSWFNRSKCGWGISKYLPKRNDWCLYDTEKADLRVKCSKLERENIRLQEELRKYKFANRNQYKYSWEKEKTLYSKCEKAKKQKHISELKKRNDCEFYVRQKTPKEFHIPCKAILYDKNRKIISIKTFDSYIECYKELGISRNLARGMMKGKVYVVFIDSDSRPRGTSKEWFRNKTLRANCYLRIVAVTPMNKELIRKRKI